MKKTYITPSLFCVKICTNAIIAGSLDGMEIKTEETPIERGSVWTRQNNTIWDDEW